MNVANAEHQAQVATLRIRLCEGDYVLPITTVVEVAAMVESASLVKQAHPALHGVVIRHGDPLVLVDLRYVFQCEERPVTTNTLFIVVAHGAEMVGLIVDEVLGVVYFDDNEIRTVGGESGYLRGVVAHQNSLLQWVNTDAVLKDILPHNE